MNGYGGGFYVFGAVTDLQLSATTFVHCAAARGGGLSMYHLTASVLLLELQQNPVVFSHVKWLSNVALDSGGSVHLQQMSVAARFDACEFDDSWSLEAGGALFAVASFVQKVTLADCSIQHCRVNTGHGGAIFVHTAELWIDRTTISHTTGTY